MFIRRYVSFLVGLLVCLLVSGCGGGGGGGDTSSTSASSSGVTQVTTFWRFDTVAGNSSPVTSAPGLDAQLSGASIVTGRIGNAVQLDASQANSFITIPVLIHQAQAGRTLIFPENSASAAFWINPSTLVPGATYHLFGGGYWGVQSFHIRLVDGKVTFQVRNPNNGVDELLLTSNNAVTVGSWTHIAVTYDGSAVRIYLDGVLDATAVAPRTIPDVVNNLFVGGVGDGSAPMTFPGAIDELLLTSSVLTPGQINQLLMGFRP